MTSYGRVTITITTLCASEGFLQHWALLQFRNLKICLKITNFVPHLNRAYNLLKNSLTISFSDTNFIALITFFG